MADRAQSRLHRRYWRLVNLTKPHTKAVVAVARELTGFIWATLCRPGIVDERDQKRTKSQKRDLKTPAPMRSRKYVLNEKRNQHAVA
jgi:hypothetical protein